ncbi:xanthine dehydrogenase family protein molybdopterin-binding subunit [Roseomonas sp. 18066]|uniref:xanthine dehydrogenase family protein molybdopterin-binding subunit n=1 Tax=Roseomonas sp. 18066 TaxID=2681412 RepID=UPI00135C7DBD|nr:xanthine dehydrogenase family protein molybdopterin-binding subunit [Roseomonas sp. 18066]
MTSPLNPELKRRTLVQATMMTGAALTASGAAQAAAPAEANAVRQPVKHGAVGSSLSRADGAVKVKGTARYAIEQPLARMAYGVLVQSTIPAGRIRAIDTAATRASPGVLAVYTHESGFRINRPKRDLEGGAATEVFVPLQDNLVRWNGQHIAIVVAESFEQATEAAALVTVAYEASEALLHPTDSRAHPQPMDAIKAEWGDAAAAFASAPVKVEGVYTTPREYNVPMEPHACVAAWEGDRLTVWEPSQWVGGARQVISEWMGLDIEKVRVVSPYVGGGFGSKIAPHPHVSLACIAARELGRPVKVSLTRPQTFTGLGGRPRTHQRLALGATRDGQLVSIVHEGWNETAIDDTHVEPTNSVTTLMYATPNLSSRHSIIPVNTVNPSWLRAPGENPSTYALETAMDELAHTLGMDPVALRLKNWADQDPKAKIPWTTRQLREAYAAGAEAFGWSRRNPAPRSMREGRELIGWGMAAGTYPVWRQPGEAKIILHADGRVEVHSGGVDIGTGTYTILAQAAAEVLGVPVERVSVSLGDTDLPRAPVAGGSQLANILMGAVHTAAVATRTELLNLAASDPKSPLRSARVNDLVLENGQIRPSRRPTGGVAIADLLKAVERERLEVHRDTFPTGATEAQRNAGNRSFTLMQPATASGGSAHAWSAQFVEVRVDEDFGTVRVKRMVAAFDSGLVFNPKLARSQWIGGMIMGIGQALLEEGLIDPRDGRVVNANLADYAVAVNADVPEIQTISVGIPDLQATPRGGKAVGELGIVGVAAAISNAVFHATGKRIRDLPITIEKLVGA